MNHHDHVNLLRAGVTHVGGTWADLGSGGGAFTLALAELLGDKARIISIDKDARVLRDQERAMQSTFSRAHVEYRQADFSKRLEIPSLDGVVMANSLHFHQNKLPILAFVREYLKPGGHLLLAEYNIDNGNTWVPYPLSFGSWEKLAREAGFSHTRLLASRPSRFLHEIYSAASTNPG